jgi:hypothetical protein
VHEQCECRSLKRLVIVEIEGEGTHNVMKGFGNVSEENLEEWLQSDACDHDYQCMTDANVIRTLQDKVIKKGMGRM